MISLFRSHHRILCPVHSVVYRFLHLQEKRGTPSAPLSTYFPVSFNFSSIRIAVGNSLYQPPYTAYLPSSTIPFVPSHISTTLKQAVTFLGPSFLGSTANDISARSLRISGTMALFNSKVDPLTI